VALQLKEIEMQYKTWKNISLIVLFAVVVFGAHALAVTVPAGSVDQLAEAIAQAGPGGEVILAAGVHKISATVMVEIPVSIVGEEGAILETANSTDDEGVKPALYIKGADGVRIQNLIIQTPLDPNVAPASNGILIENASDVQIIDSQIAGHVNGVLVEHGDRALLKGNAIQTTGHSVVVINGKDVSIQDNWISGVLTGLGLWVGDERGDITGNTFQGCGIGLLLCTPRGFLISGEWRMTDSPATGWMVYENNAVGGAWGYLAMDGANNNILMNNSASLNTDYDIELAGESSRFGFVAPTSSDNIVIQGLKYKGLKVKVCGVNNQAQGHVNLVDTIADPCF
jgi:nitrous oxidase accessory protein NosD